MLMRIFWFYVFLIRSLHQIFGGERMWRLFVIWNSFVEPFNTFLSVVDGFFRWKHISVDEEWNSFSFFAIVHWNEGINSFVVGTFSIYSWAFEIISEILMAVSKALSSQRVKSESLQAILLIRIELTFPSRNYPLLWNFSSESLHAVLHAVGYLLALLLMNILQTNFCLCAHLHRHSQLDIFFLGA